MDKIKLILNLKQKSYLSLIFFSIIVSITEFIGLALLIPLISISSSQTIPNNSFVEKVIEIMSINKFETFFICFSLGMVIFYILRFFINLLFQYNLIKFLNNIKHLTMITLYNHFIYLRYDEFIKLNSSDLKKLVYNESSNVQYYVQSILTLISELIVLCLLLSLVFYSNWKLALFVLVLFAILFIITRLFTKNKIEFLSNERLKFPRELIKNIDETLNNFKIVKLISGEKISKSEFFNNSIGTYRTSLKYETIQQIPKISFETLGILIIISILYYLVTNKMSNEIIFTIGVYAITFYRALPSIIKIINSFNNIKYYKTSLNLIFQALNLEKETLNNDVEVNFVNRVELKDINFFHGEKAIFKDFDFHFLKGEKIGIVGESGSGKSTLIDILMGLYKLKNSRIIVDDVEINETNIISWRKKFGYIPQQIYLFDGTIADNISFALDYDEKKVIKVLKQANMYDFINEREGLNTIVGEGGIQLSGGQKQRIGIARALYSDPEILVLDEATSALDNETEELIMKEIYNICKDKTLIIIAHRKNTLNLVDRIIKINKRKIENE